MREDESAHRGHAGQGEVNPTVPRITLSLGGRRFLPQGLQEGVGFLSVRESAGHARGRLQDLAGVIGLSLVVQDRGEEIGDIRSGADALYGGAEQSIRLIEMTGSVVSPSQCGEDLRRSRGLPGVGLGDLQAAQSLGSVVLVNEAKSQQISGGEIGGGLPVQRFQDLLGGGQVSKMPGDQGLQAPRLVRGRVKLHRLVGLGLGVGGTPLVQQPPRAGNAHPPALVGSCFKAKSSHSSALLAFPFWPSNRLMVTAAGSKLGCVVNRLLERCEGLILLVQPEQDYTQPLPSLTVFRLELEPGVQVALRDGQASRASATAASPASVSM